MSACRHRPEDGCVFTACSSVLKDAGGKRVCLCAAEVRGEQPESRAARVPDSARTERESA